MIRVKCLNGDLIELDNIENVENKLAKLWSVYHSQIHLLPTEENEFDFLVMVHPDPVITLKSTDSAYQYHYHYLFARECTNESIIRHFLLFPQHLPILSNPHPIVVEFIINNKIFDNHHTYHNYRWVFANPSDAIVDIILSYLHLQNIPWDMVCSNSNPRVIETMLKYFRDHIRNEQFGLLDDDRAVQWVWDHQTEFDKRYNNIVMSNTVNELAVSITYSEWTAEWKTKKVVPAAFGKYKHPKILDTYIDNIQRQLKQLSLSSSMDFDTEFLRNEAAGEWIRENIDVLLSKTFNRDTFLKKLSKNKSSFVVQWFLDDPFRIRMPSFLANPHPAAVEFCKSYLVRHSIKPGKEIECLLENTNPDLFIFAWHHFPVLHDEVQTWDVERVLAMSDRVVVEYKR